MADRSSFKIEKSKLRVPEAEFFGPGARSCAGCGEILAVRHALKAIGKNSIVVGATGCMEIISSPYPESAWKTPWIHSLFENAAAVASGAEGALKALGKSGIRVVVMAGDGALADIGFGSVSGALDRKQNLTYILTDNEAYMNTGIQSSGMTPYGAWTTTTPVGDIKKGKEKTKKDLVRIMLGHGVKYIATASIAYPVDLVNKVKKAVSVDGPSFVHINCPCPVGWNFPSEKTIELARLAVDAGLWILYEVENGVLEISHKPAKLKPVKEYLALQGRFRHLSDAQIEKIQSDCTKSYEGLLSRDGKSLI